MSEHPIPYKPPPQVLQALREGAYSLLGANLPDALAAFQDAYQLSEWRGRALAVAGMGDIIDTRRIEQGKRPAIMTALDWEVSDSLSLRDTALSDERLLVLLDTFMNPALSAPRTAEERRVIQALRQTVRHLERVLLQDSHHLVRFDALIMLTQQLGDRHRPYVYRTLAAAHDQETNDMLKAVLAAYLDS